MEIEDLLMQIQSYLCQLKVEDLGEIAKTLGSGNSDIKDKNRKGLVRWIEEHLEAELKGSAEEKSEYLEDFKVGIITRLIVPCSKMQVRKQSPKHLSRN